MLFSDLKLNTHILSALKVKGYTSPTPIQAAAIPPLLEGKDLMGCAQTGTGKTAAFALPILHNLSLENAGNHKKIRALILAPTRELALQIGESFLSYGHDLNLRVATIFGGVSDHGQKQKLRQGIDILVATPGRLLDLLDQRALVLSHIEIFVLDEADRMLDMGFIHDVRKISALLPVERQTLLFSATMPPEIRNLSKNLQRNPSHIEVAAVSSTAENIEQTVYHVPRNLKPSLLRQLLADVTIKRALVFTRTKHGADRICKVLDRHRISADAIHGNKTQGARQRALAGFKEGSVRILVATDIAARGIDVTEISHVFNYDLPEVPETYVHRIGRTARAGASGIAVAFCDAEERSYLKGIERLTRQQLRVLQTPALQSEPSMPSNRDSERPRNEPPRQPGRPNFLGRPEQSSRYGQGGQNARSERPPIHHESRMPIYSGSNSESQNQSQQFGRRNGGQSGKPSGGNRFSGKR